MPPLVLVHFSAPVIPDGPGLTDYLTGWGTIALAVVTVFAIGVTLRTTRTDRRRDDERRKEDREDAIKRAYDRQLAQARLVIIGELEISSASPLGDGRNSYDIRFPVVNYGDRPVIGIQVEIWVDGTPLTEPCTRAAKERYLLPEDNLTLELTTNSRALDLHLSAWRIRWTDADGQQWFVDQPQQPEPLSYKAEPPRPH
jgi:hypothetical protein